MGRGRKTADAMREWEKTISVMLSGKPMKKAVLAEMLNVPEDQVARKVFEARTYGNAKVESIRDGRPVVAYKLENVEDMRQYLIKRNFLKEAVVSVPEDVKTVVAAV